MQTTVQKENPILTGPIWKQLIIFGLPLLLGNLFQQLYGSVDSVIVGRFVSGQALAAVGSTSSLIFLIVSFFQGIATGASVVISQYFGARQVDKVRSSISTSLMLSVIAGTASALVFFFLTPYMLQWMLTPADIIELSREYTQIYMLSIPFIAIYNTGTAVLRAMGDSRRPLYFLVFSSLVNIGLDLLFVCFFHWSVAGAAWATVIAQLVSALMILFILTRKTSTYGVPLREFAIHKDLAKKIIALGLPAAVQNSAVSLANVLFQSQVNLFGSVAVAGYSAASRINAFTYMPCSAFGLAVTTFVGQNMGAGNHKRVRECARVCTALSVGITLVFSLVIYLFRYPLLGVFTTEADVIEQGALMLTVIGLGCFLWAFPQIYGCVLTGMGKSFPAMVVTMANMCVVRLIWIFTLLRFWNDILVVYLSFPVSWVTAGICMLLYYSRTIRRQPADTPASI